MKKVKIKRNPVDPDQRSVTSGYSFSDENLKKLRRDALAHNMSISGYMDMLIVNDIKRRAARNRRLLQEQVAKLESSAKAGPRLLTQE